MSVLWFKLKGVWRLRDKISSLNDNDMEKCISLGLKIL